MDTRQMTRSLSIALGIIAVLLATVAAPAAADPAPTATAKAGVSLYIAPRIEIREDSRNDGGFCASASASQGLLSVVKEDGSRLTSCDTTATISERLDTGSTLLVTPV